MSFSRMKKVYDVYRVIFLFFKRKVMGFGLMKNKLFRIVLGILILAFIGGMSAVLYMFWKQTDSTIPQTTIVLDVYALTVIMWTFCCFLFIKILFMKTDRFLKFTCQFPVTQRETKAAVLMFELMFSLAVIFTIAFSMVISLLIRYGTHFIGRILCNIFFVPITFFLALDLLYVIMEFILEKIGVSKMKGVVMFCMNTAFLLTLYFAGYNKLINSLLFGYLDEKGTSPIVIYAFLMEKFGLPAAILAFLVIIAILIMLILLVPAAIGEAENSYLKLRKSSVRAAGEFTSYMLSICRDIDSFNYTIISIFIFVFMAILKKDMGIYATALLCLNGLYAFVHTDKIRTLLYQKKYSVLRDYVFLIGSQFVYAAAVTLPLSVVSFILFRNLKHCLLVYPVLLISIILFTLIGILFPPKKDNPFSSCVGIGVVMILVIAIIVACGLLHIPQFVQILVAAAAVCGSIVFSISGIYNLKRSETYEKA